MLRRHRKHAWRPRGWFSLAVPFHGIGCDTRACATWQQALSAAGRKQIRSAHPSSIRSAQAPHAGGAQMPFAHCTRRMTRLMHGAGIRWWVAIGTSSTCTRYATGQRTMSTHLRRRMRHARASASLASSPPELKSSRSIAILPTRQNTEGLYDSSQLRIFQMRSWLHGGRQIARRRRRRA